MCTHCRTTLATTQILKQQNITMLLNFYHRKCDLPACDKVNPLSNVFHGCGHSFHIECLLPNIGECPICKVTLLSLVDTLGKTANDAVFAAPAAWVNDHDSGDESEIETQADDDDQSDDDYDD